MAGLINDLMDRINEMASFIEALSSLANSKKDIIISNDVGALKNITAQENTLVGKFQKAEKTAAVILQDIAMVLNQNAAELTLGRLGDLIREQEDYGEYSKAYERLKQGLYELKERNDTNNVLIESALDYINYTINAVRTSFGSDGDVTLDTKN